MRVSYVAIPLLFLLSFVFAQTFTELFPSWVVLIAAALGVGFGLSAVAYAISSAFKIPELDAWAKLEFGEVTATAFLIAIIIIAIGASDAVFQAAVGKKPLEGGAAFLNETRNKLVGVFFDSINLNLALSIITGPPVTLRSPSEGSGGGGAAITAGKEPSAGETPTGTKFLGIPIPIYFIALTIGNVGFYPYSGVGVFTKHLSNLQSITLMAAGISIAMEIALAFIKEVALPVLIPLGVFLRCFTLTRKMGSTLIAFGLGLYFFFPASVLMAEWMYNGIPKSIRKPDINIFGMATPDVGKIVEPFTEGPDLGYCGRRIADLRESTSWEFCGTENKKSCSGWDLKCWAKFFCRLVTFFWCLIIQIVIWLGEVVGALVELAKVAYFIAAGSAPMQSAGLGNILGGFSAPVLSIFGLVGAFISSPALSVKIAKGMIEYTPYVLQYAIPVILLPVVALIVVVTAIRSISPAIGGEVQILGISELI